jgi:hypothetical protein
LRCVRQRVTGTTLLGALAVASLMAGLGWIGPSAAVAQAPPSHEVTFEPDPPVAYDELTATVTRNDCPPGEDVSARLQLDQLRGDIVELREMAHDAATVDGDGNVTLVLEVDTAYPGSWRVESICGVNYDTAAYEQLDIPPPPDFVAGIEPTAARRGETVTLSVAGAACFGDMASWEVALHPIAGLIGSAVEPRPDGTWDQRTEVTVPEDFELDEVVFLARCIHEDDDIWVHYAGTPFRILPAAGAPPDVDGPHTQPPPPEPPPAASGPVAPPAEPQVSRPTFTG